MNFLEVLKSRRAVRQYTHTEITRGDLQALIEAAIEAPSAMNLQPWAFAVIIGRERIDHYGVRAKKWLLQNLGQWSEQEHVRKILEDPDFNLFYGAPALILVMAKKPDAQSLEDCCLAAENLMLAAREMRLGTCWIGFARSWLNQYHIKAELGLPQDYTIVAPIVAGYPVSWPESTGRRRPEIHWVTPVTEQKQAETAVR